MGLKDAEIREVLYKDYYVFALIRNFEKATAFFKKAVGIIKCNPNKPEGREKTIGALKEEASRSFLMH